MGSGGWGRGGDGEERRRESIISVRRERERERERCIRWGRGGSVLVRGRGGAMKFIFIGLLVIKKGRRKKIQKKNKGQAETETHVQEFH